MRFSELRTVIGGISQKMLTTTLRNLERDGFVTRTAFATIPPRVDYELTALGRELLVPVNALGDWARRQHRAASTRRVRDSTAGMIGHLRRRAERVHQLRFDRHRLRPAVACPAPP